MNIVYLHCHDAGRYIQPYGHALPTPCLQRFAEHSTVFRQAFCAAPTCSPSRSALLTGQSAHGSGMIGLAGRGFSLSRPERHLAAYLGRQGFHTVLSGIQHEFAADAAKPYNEIITPGGNSAGNRDINAAQAAAAFIRQKHDKPFFLSCGFFTPHRPFVAADPDINPDRVAVPACLPDTPEVRQDMAEYASTVRVMDQAAGVVLEALRQAGRMERTVVIFTTDHGIAFPHMKCNLTDTGIGVSLMVHCPGNRLSGRALDAMVSHVDVFPTVCELAGVPAPEWLEGRSLAPLLRGEAASVREELFAEVTYHAAYEPMRCIRTPRYKLIRIFDDDLSPVPANIDAGHSKTLVVQEWLKRSRAAVQLYDLLLDPAERNNLADSAAHAGVRADLERRLADWMKRTDDPLLAGPVPLPAGAMANLRSDLNAHDRRPKVG